MEKTTSGFLRDRPEEVFGSDCHEAQEDGRLLLIQDYSDVEDLVMVTKRTVPFVTKEEATMKKWYDEEYEFAEMGSIQKLLSVPMAVSCSD